MTSLQRQLAAIAATSTHQLDLKAQKTAHAKSLLFEPKIAASQSFDSLYIICHDGFRDLCALDQRFVPFSNTIFSEQSKAEDRTQMSKKDNEELDAVLEEFLTLVGPRLLLKPAVKAVEWLIRRFRVHENNTEITILTFLPYYSMPIFQALLSILPAQLPNSCRFLSPYITSLENPPRRAIVHTASNSPDFFAAFQGYAVKVLEAAHHSSSFLSFWSAVTTQAIDAMLEYAQSGRREVQDQKREDLLLRVFPVLNECMKLTNIPEALIGCYMIIVILVAKSAFEDKILDSLMEAVAHSLLPDTLESSLVCLSIIAEERSDVVLPTRVAKRLLKLQNFADSIVSLVGRYRVERLALGCALAVVENVGRYLSVSERKEALSKILESRVLNDRQISIISSAALRFSKERGLNGSDESPQEDVLDYIISRCEESMTTIQNGTATPEDEDATMEDVDEADSKIPSEAAPALPSIKESSFLVDQQSGSYEQASLVFVRTVTMNHSLDTLLGSPEIRRDEAEKNPLYLSFLIRIWCGPYPVSARQAALRAAKPVLQKSSTAVDFQLLIPYLIQALADAALPVRRSASECVIILAEALKGKDKAPKAVWGSSDLYGKASDNSRLCPEQTAKFLSSVLVPIMEEATMDPKHASASITAVLSGSGSSSDIKVPDRTAFASFLATQGVLTPLVRVRLQLHSIFDFVGKTVASVRVNKLLPAVRDWCLLSGPDAEVRCRREALELADVDRRYLSILSPREPESITLLKDIVCGNVGQDRETLREAAFERLNNIWTSLKSELRVDLASSLLDQALEDDDATNELETFSRIQARDTLRNVKLTTPVLVTFLQSIPNNLRMPDGPPATKRRRTSRSEMARVDVQTPEETARVLRRVTLVLELIEGSNPGEHPELFKGLFGILAELHQFKQQSGSSLVYLQSMILGSLLPIVNTLKESEDASEYRSAIRADLLIDCIRNSSNPQVQNGALLLIASLASWEPEMVLHNLMPIFTFIGSTLLRQKDDYSAHVVDQTISRVVPQLAASLKKRNRNFLAGVADLLFSFTAAFDHIPEHRRLMLFCQLAHTLGPEDSLSAIIAILVDKYPESRSQKKFVCEFLKQFEPEVVLQMVHGYLELVRDAVRPKRTVSDTLFGLSEKQPGLVDLSIENLLTSLAELTKEKSVRRHIGKAFRKSDKVDPRHIFSKIVEMTVIISQQVKGKPEIYEACSKALSSCLDLLPTIDLIKSAQLLVSSESNAQVRAAAIKAVEIRTEHIPQNDSAAISAVLGFLPEIEALVQSSEEVNVKLIALSCVDQVIEKFGKKDPSAVMSVGQVVSGEQSFASEDDRLRILSLVCFASMVEVAGENFISLLPNILPTMFKYLGESITLGNKADLYKAIYALLGAIIEHIGFMFTVDNIEEALKLSLRSSAAQLGEECDHGRRQFYDAMAKQLDARNIFTAIKRTWPDAIHQGSEAMQESLDLLLLTVENQSKAQMIKVSPIAFSLLLDVFDLRSQGLTQSQLAAEDLDRLEDTMNEAVISMTLKLNDTTFRPFFVQLVDWLSASKKDKTPRATTFYRFLSEFFGRFKSIVTSYANHILDHAAKTLEDLSKAADRPELRVSVITALHKTFLHDQDGFWQAPTHFSTILKPLMQQLTIQISPEVLSDTIIPAITELATSASSLDNHKEMNSILLKLMRSEEAYTRLAAVQCEQSLTEKLGEEWLGLLAEMLPFISELREDDDESVERETQRWINIMEKILGEDLEGMLA